MSIKLTWSDLIVDDFTPAEASEWLSEWSWLVGGKLAPIFLSKFGDWFLRRPDGTTEVLDVIEGNLSTVAQTPEEFDKLMNNQTWQEEKLLSLFVFEFHEKGIVPGRGQCYGFAPHPAVAGGLKPETVMVMDIPVWESICSQIFKGSA